MRPLMQYPVDKDVRWQYTFSEQDAMDCYAILTKFERLADEWDNGQMRAMAKRVKEAMYDSEVRVK